MAWLTTYHSGPGSYKKGQQFLHVRIQKYMITNVYTTNLAEGAEIVQYWVRNLHFCLYHGQFLTDSKKSQSHPTI